MNESLSSDSIPALSKPEVRWLVAAILLGAVVRLSYPGRMAVEHFDEGVYASNFWFGPEENYSYPMRHLYAPPLLPFAIEWTMILAATLGIKPTGFIPMIPSLVAGMAMIPSIWWVGRRWFGPTAGLISAWLVATSDLHSCYSRAALTDVPVCLFILWAVYFTWSALLASAAVRPFSEGRGRSKLEQKSAWPVREILLAGLMTGLAWWTKYNGWLPLAIGLAGGMFWQVTTPAVERRIVRVLNCWLAIAMIAIAVWSPVIYGLQSVGGYASVAANHRQYVVGIAGWRDSAYKQSERIGMYENYFGMLTEHSVVPAIVNATNVGLSNRTLYESLNALLQLSQNSAAGMYVGWFNQLVVQFEYVVNHCVVHLLTSGLLMLAMIVIAVRLRRPGTVPCQAATSLLAAWLCGMTVATPFYYPYPRLVFPWLTATWLALGLAMQMYCGNGSGNSDQTGPAEFKTWRPTRAEWIFVVWLAANCLIRSIQGTGHAWQDRTGFQESAREFAQRIRSQIPASSDAQVKAAVYVWGEPALVNGLKASGVDFAIPIQNLDFVGQRQPLPTFIAFAQHTFQSREFQAARKQIDKCKYSQVLHYQPSHLIDLDDQNTENFYGRIPIDARLIPMTNNIPSVWLYRAP